MRIPMLFRCICVVASAMTCFETRLGCIGSDRQSWHQQMINSNSDIFRLTLKLRFAIPFFKLFLTPTWQMLIEREDFFFRNGQKLVDKTIELIRNQQGSDNDYKFLKSLLSRQELSYNDISIITLSLFADGLSTTVPSMEGILYCLASNPDKQEKLRQEITQLIPDKHAPVTYDVIQRASYLKACIKEGFRLFPVGVDVSRISQKNMTIGGYRIPAGTRLSLNNNLLLRLPEYFRDPEKFIPERWVREESQDNVHPYLLLPFSFGVRTCAGMRLAEQEMRLVIIKLLQQFRLDWPKTEPELRQQYVMLLKPDRPARVQFTARL